MGKIPWGIGDIGHAENRAIAYVYLQSWSRTKRVDNATGVFESGMCLRRSSKLKLKVLHRCNDKDNQAYRDATEYRDEIFGFSCGNRELLIWMGLTLELTISTRPIDNNTRDTNLGN